MISKTVWPLILISVIAAAIAIGAYVLVIRKYYWGPKGAPKPREKNKPADG
jgi:NADH:ubiquinone oxidoreductase subunit 2 (subunit N)